MISQSASLFKKNFMLADEYGLPIVIYGLGAQTKEILSECDNDRIVGLLDGFRTDGEFCGRPILSLESLIGKNVKIVIVARSASAHIIYRRIRGFCSEQGIPVYNLQGEVLRQEEDVCYYPYFERNQEELLSKAAEYDTISFDVFDTLLMRKVSDRETFFQMIENKYHATFPYAKWRLQAELELSRTSVPAIEDIYEWIHERAGVANEELCVLLRGELAMEESLLVPRLSMVNVLHQLVQNGKKVYLISDMYLPQDFIKKVLGSRGISEYEGLFVSCEYGTGKGENLYEIYKENSSGGKRLHIGDSRELDGECANMHGIDSYPIMSAMEMAELTRFGLKMGQCDKSNGIQGLLYAKVFNDPFALYNSNSKIILDDAYTQGYALMGPLMVGYVHWFYENIKRQNIDRILFISRDGYLVKKIYDMYVKNKVGPRSLYFLTSRSLAVLASIKTSEDIIYAMSLPFSGTPQDMLLKRFQLEKSEVRQYQKGESEREYILKHKKFILNRAAEIRSNYQKYYEQFLLEKGKTAIFDFVSTGTCHACLEKILGFSMDGYYFEKIASTDERKQSLNIQDFVHSHGSVPECNNYFLLETWIKSTEPSVKKVLQNGQIVLGQNRISQAQLMHIEQIQNGAINFCRDYLETKELGLSEDIESLALHLLPLLNDENVEMHLAEWENYDEFTERIIQWD